MTFEEIAETLINSPSMDARESISHGKRDPYLAEPEKQTALLVFIARTLVDINGSLAAIHEHLGERQ